MTERYDAAWVRQFYDDYGEKEWGRLVKDPVNEVRLHVQRHYLQKHIRPGAQVLEIGPGPGRFTQILAEVGARIVLVDISPGQLALNRSKAAEHGFEHAVERRHQLDMCDMAALDDRAFDAVVCYGGPLSYVFEQRGAAVAEVLRVLKAGGVALFGVMSLWGAMHEFLDGVLPVSRECNREIIASGDLCPQTYPACTHHCHLFRAGELRQFLEGCGAAVVEMSASNCLSSARGDRLDDARKDPDQWRQLLEMEIEACREPGCLDMGTHIIAVVRKPKRREGAGQ